MTNLVTVPQGGTMLDVLAERYRTAFAKMEGGRGQWIEGTLELAAVMLEARKLIPDHREFSQWLRRHDLHHVTEAERAALYGFAKDPLAARKMMEASTSKAWRTIWEKRPKGTPSKTGGGPISRVSGASKRKRAAIIPTVMRDDYVSPPPPPPRKELSSMMLTPEQVDPDFNGTPLEFTTKYGHVLLHTKDQIEQTKRQEALMAWLGTVADLERTGRTMLAALAKVDPAAVAEWTSKPSKAEKLRAWRDSIQVACEAICSIGKVP